MRELKAKEKKEFIVETVHTAVVKSFNISNPHSLPLADFFNFNLSFSILPDVISDNIPVLFL